MTWILTALAGAFIGGFFCFLLTLLTRFPRRSLSVGPFTWTGLLPLLVHNHFKKQVIQAVRSAKLSEQVHGFLLAETTRDLADSWVQSQLARYLKTTLPEKWPMLALMIGEKTQDKIYTAVSEHIQSSWTDSMLQLQQNYLSQQKLEDLLIRIMQVEETERWTEKIWISLQRAIPYVVLVFALVGSIIALLVKLLIPYLL